MNIKETDAYNVTKIDSSGTSHFHPVIGEECMNMLEGFRYIKPLNMWVNEDESIKYILEKIG